MSSFRIGPLLFGANGESNNGLFYNKIKDWYDVKNDDVDSDARPGQDGSFTPEEVYQSKATPTLEGVYVGTSAADVQRMKMILRSLKNGGKAQDVSWDDQGFVTRRRAFVMNVAPAHSAGRSGYSFAIDMLAHDPALYGPVVASGPVGPVSPGEGGLRFDEWTGRPAATGVGPGLVFPETYGTLGSDGRLSITNDGTAPAYSEFTFIGGSSQGFTITRISTGEVIWIAREIPEGAIVKVSPRTGRVTINGSENDITGSLRSDDWWATDPMTTEQVQLGVLGTTYGTPTLSAETSATY